MAGLNLAVSRVVDPGSACSSWRASGERRIDRFGFAHLLVSSEVIARRRIIRVVVFIT